MKTINVVMAIFALIITFTTSTVFADAGYCGKEYPASTKITRSSTTYAFFYEPTRKLVLELRADNPKQYTAALAKEGFTPYMPKAAYCRSKSGADIKVRISSETTTMKGPKVIVDRLIKALAMTDDDHWFYLDS
ncbi:MAG: hypothetical protein ABH881_04130 [bacterium]